LNAIQALSQLSYGPFRDQKSGVRHRDESRIRERLIPDS
jgi:hypothetical protein